MLWTERYHTAKVIPNYTRCRSCSPGYTVDCSLTAETRQVNHTHKHTLLTSFRQARRRSLRLRPPGGAVRSASSRLHNSRAEACSRHCLVHSRRCHVTRGSSPPFAVGHTRQHSTGLISARHTDHYDITVRRAIFLCDLLYVTYLRGLLYVTCELHTSELSNYYAHVTLVCICTPIQTGVGL